MLQRFRNHGRAFALALVIAHFIHAMVVDITSETTVRAAAQIVEKLVVGSTY